ncbi:MAG TPA: M28 family peptidase [Solirubrobacteraceae bacterium]|jgi:hypothetical protein
MFNGRIYRVALLPLLLAVVVAGFSFTGPPAPVSSNLAPDAFNGTRAAEELMRLSREFPARRPGGVGDERLALRIEREIRKLGAPANGGFRVSVHRFNAQTIDGQRTLTNVVAERPGSTGASPIVVLAHRDAAGVGARAELSGTAVLLELARVFASRETRRTIILVSTSGGSGGDAGAAEFAAESPRPLDAAIVLGDLASSRTHTPFVVSYSDGLGNAPARLTATVQNSITQEIGAQPGTPSLIAQFAHLAFPLATGEQGPLNAQGIAAVLVQVSGVRGPSAHAQIRPERIDNFGRAVLNAIDAFDTAPDISSSSEATLAFHGELIPGWALRLLAIAMILPVLLLAIDAFARVRRRREAVAGWAMWTLSLAAPFLACALLVVVLAALGLAGASPPEAVSAQALSLGATAIARIAVIGLIFLCAWWGRFRLMRHLPALGRPDTPAAGVAVLLVFIAATLLVWLANPFAALLLIPVLHLLALIADPELRSSRPVGLALLGLALTPACGLLAFYAHELGLGPLGAAWTVLTLTGAQLGLFGVILASVVAGCLLGVLLLALQGRAHTHVSGESVAGGRVYPTSHPLDWQEPLLRS